MTSAEAKKLAAQLREWERIANARANSDGHDVVLYDSLATSLRSAQRMMYDVIGSIVMTESDPAPKSTSGA